GFQNGNPGLHNLISRATIMEKWLTWLISPGVLYFIYLGLLLPFVRDDSRPVVIVVGIPFAISAAYLWHRTQLAGILPRSWPHIVFYDANHQLRAMLDVVSEGPRLELYDRDGNSRAKLTVLEDEPHLGLFDASGRAIHSAP